MNKIYKAATVRKQSLFVETLAKKLILLSIGLIGTFGVLKAQNVTIGATNYTTLKAAFDAINAGTHTGAITVNINLNTTEVAMAALNSSGTGSASYTSVLVRPTANVTVTGNLANAVIQLFGADNVTIDGLNGASQLTVSNSSTSTASAVIWVSSASPSDGATTNTIKNCIITGNGTVTTGFGISSAGSSGPGSLADVANNSNTYQANTVSACRIGISVVGPSGNEINNVITGNTVGSTIAASKLGNKGISVFQQQNVAITQNNVFGLTSSAGSTTFQTTGIYVGGTISGGLIDKNKISDVRITGFWGCNGIQLQSTTSSTGLAITNNFIWDIVAGGFTDANSVDDGDYGIAVNTGGGYNIYYNSIDMSTNHTGTPGISAAFWVSPLITTTNDIRNNIFSNRKTTGTRYAIYSNASSSVFSGINYNDYFSSGQVGFLTSVRATLADWQTATGQDGNSVAVDPTFFSTVNLHLFFTSALNTLAIPIGSVNRDIDGDTRDVSTPDIGADEFTPGPCSANGGNTGGTATATPTSICASGSATLTATGYAYGKN